MKTSKLITGLALSVFALGAVPPVQAAATSQSAPVYRLYNKNTGEHFYTLSTPELISLQKAGWTPEGIGWYASLSGDPVYRIYNPNAKGGDHYYTKNKAEAAYNVSLGWKWDNNGEPAFYSGGTVNNYVAYNPNAKSGAHNYTTNLGEQNNLLGLGWTYGATAWKTLGAGTNTVDLDQIYSNDLSTIQGLWRNDKGQELEITGDKFVLDGKTNNWKPTQNGYGNVVFQVTDDTSVTPIFVLSANSMILEAHEDAIKSDLSKDRIFVGRRANSGSYFYKVGS